MTDIVRRLRRKVFTNPQVGAPHLRTIEWQAADRIETLETALLEIFDHECRTSDRSFIACTARDALWPRAALAGEKKDGS